MRRQRAVLLAVDIVHVAKRVIRPVYLLDALPEAPVAAWALAWMLRPVDTRRFPILPAARYAIGGGTRQGRSDRAISGVG